MAKNWADLQEELELFYSEVAEIMVSLRYLRSLPESAIENDAARACVSEFISDVSKLTGFNDRNEAIETFENWIKGQVAEPVASGQRIEATISRTFGDVTMTFGYSAVFEVSSSASRRAAFAFCINEVEKQFDANTTGVVVSSKSPPATTGDTGDSVFMGEKIVVESKTGTLYYKITGGKYSKYGVRVWPEVLLEFGVKVDQLEAGREYNLQRWCHIEMNGDKPKKVVKISDA